MCSGTQKGVYGERSNEDGNVARQSMCNINLTVME
jgi:hypothetical protein